MIKKITFIMVLMENKKIICKCYLYINKNYTKDNNVFAEEDDGNYKLIFPYPFY